MNEGRGYIRMSTALEQTGTGTGSCSYENPDACSTVCDAKKRFIGMFELSCLQRQYNLLAQLATMYLQHQRPFTVVHKCLWNIMYLVNTTKLCPVYILHEFKG